MKKIDSLGASVSSCLLIGGLLIGLGVSFSLINVWGVTNLVLFAISLIVIQGAWGIKEQSFYFNINTIILYAFVGTIINFLVVLALLVAVSSTFINDISSLDLALYASLIVAIDPVAVLSIFEELRVNQTLMVLIYGESVLNDAICIVLFEAIAELGESGGFEPIDLLYIFLKFLYVFVSAVAFSIVALIIALGILATTRHIHFLRPLIVIMTGVFVFMVAQTVLSSGIIAILFYALMTHKYVKHIWSKETDDSMRVMLDSIATSIELLLFVAIGATFIYYMTSNGTSQFPAEFDWHFILWNFPILLIARTIQVFSTTYVANAFRVTNIGIPAQIVLTWGGLRGVVSALLAFQIPSSVEAQPVFITTTYIIIVFTVVIQGSTVKRLLRLLGVRFVQPPKRVIDAEFARHSLSSVLPLIVGGVSHAVGTSRARRVLDELVHLADMKIKGLFIKPFLAQSRILMYKLDYATAEQLYHDETSVNHQDHVTRLKAEYLDSLTASEDKPESEADADAAEVDDAAGVSGST